MSLGQRLAVGHMAELAGVTEEQLQEWIDAGHVPLIVTEPMFEGHNPPPRIDINHVFIIRALRDGRSVEEGRKEVLANGRTGDTWLHTPPKKTEQELTREQLERDRKKLYQLRKGPK